MPVTIRLDPQRLGVKVIERTSGADLERMRSKLIDTLVAHGVRAQLRTGNLLTGCAVRGARLFPRRAAGDGGLVADASAAADHSGPARGDRGAASTDIIKKLDKMPLKEIGDDLHKALGDLDLTPG